jgi:hypothetical protein
MPASALLQQASLFQRLLYRARTYGFCLQGAREALSSDLRAVPRDSKAIPDESEAVLHKIRSDLRPEGVRPQTQKQVRPPT